MNHIDQKILELYVLNDENALQQREMIEQHLAECAGCRELYARMQDLYAGFFDTMGSSKELITNSIMPIKKKKSSALFRSPSPLQEIRANYEIDRSPIRNVVTFLRKHPIVSSSISFFVLGFFGLLGLQLFKTIEKIDDNPSYYRYSPNSVFEVYNKENKLLWSRPVDNLEEFRIREAQGIANSTLLSDINNDNKNEILTTLIFSGEKHKRPSLRVFTNTGNFLRETLIRDTSFYFRNYHYNTDFWIESLGKFKTNVGKENLFSVAGCGRSPIFFERYDGQLNLLGRYWHFGAINVLQIDLNNDGIKEMLLVGRNDIDDDKNKDFAFITFLNPEKITGDVEATDTRGFGLQLSNAEIVTMRFPISSIENATMIRALPQSIAFENENIFSIQFSVAADQKKLEFLGFTYSFKKSDLGVLDIQYNTRTARIFDDLKREGKIKGEFNKQYLKNLKNGVEYFDGTKWVKTPTKILHPTETLGAR